MVSERNRVIELEKYLSSLGIDINIGTTKARGNKGVFIYKNDRFRIDISKQSTPNKILRTLLHEFAHFIHYSYDKKLSSLDFIFKEGPDNEIKEELINITVQDIPKEFAASLFKKKEILHQEIEYLKQRIKIRYPDIQLSKPNKDIERNFSTPLKYLLKYDKVKWLNQIYSISELDKFSLNEAQEAYLKLKSKQRCLKRINSRINRLNKYYKSPSELFARFIELYYTNTDKAHKIAPKACLIIEKDNIPYLAELRKIIGII